MVTSEDYLKNIEEQVRRAPDSETVESVLKGMTVEPGDVKPGQVIEGSDRLKGEDTDDPSYGKIHSIESAGWIYMWNTRTGDASLHNRNMVPLKLRDRFPDGEKERVWTLLPVKGTQAKEVQKLKCRLHVDEREPIYDSWGLPDCKKSNIPNESSRIAHMRVIHPREWETIQEDKRERERQEDRELNRTLIQTVTRQAQSNNPGEVLDAITSDTTKDAILNEVQEAVEKAK